MLELWIARAARLFGKLLLAFAAFTLFRRFARLTWVELDFIARAIVVEMSERGNAQAYWLECAIVAAYVVLAAELSLGGMALAWRALADRPDDPRADAKRMRWFGASGAVFVMLTCTRLAMWALETS